MILANNLGVVFASENTVMEKGENYQTFFDLGGLHDDMKYMMTKRTSLAKVGWI